MDANIVAYYTENAEKIGDQYDQADQSGILQFLRESFDLVRAPGARYALDLGAGQGHYAIRLAEDFNLQVIALEPVAAMRLAGQQKFPHESIRWVDGAMPSLPDEITGMNGAFCFAASLASWHYMDAQDRQETLGALALLMPPGSRFCITHPYPPSREHQFSIPAEETLRQVRDSKLWTVERHAVLPYPVKANATAAKSKAQILAFDLKRC